MYKAFFGLNDNPFSIAPNPHYLFLSARHREALAHLTYGLGETGGFVLLTGEVGTGKTTVSRSLLGQLPDHTDTAFILNPSLTELELLATLCDELGIRYQESPSLKQLTDLISQYLLANHQRGRNTVLIIDEAQHLRPEVLEQLRLLTNLETDTKKLLQVILIGQPELQQLLKRQELRQLAQRITARYHLLPLTVDEVGLYVQHRLQVAGRFEPLFNRKAVAALHRFSGVIPRLINLICERALMAAYGQSRLPIDHKMVHLAAEEVLGEQPHTRPWALPLATAAVLVAAFVSGIWWFSSDDYDVEQRNAITTPQPSEIVVAPKHPDADTALESTERVASAADITTYNIGQQTVLTDAIAASRDIDVAYAALFAVWEKAPLIGLTACQAAQQQGLACYQQQGNWLSINRLNYPAVVYLVDEQQQNFYGTVVTTDGEQLLLQLGEQQLWVSRDWFTRHFSGTFEILWRSPHEPLHDIGKNSNSSQIQWLENSLARIEDQTPRYITQFDSHLEQRLMAFQRNNGLRPDGIAGRQTLIRLNLLLSTEGPRLQQGNYY